MKKSKGNDNQKAWIVSVDMGYGHQRAAYPLKRFAFKNKIITANTYPGIPSRDRQPSSYPEQQAAGISYPVLL